MKKVGILGSGPVGQALANGFLKVGHEVMIGTGDVKKLTEWKSKAGQNAYTGSFADAAKFGEMIILAVKGNVAVDLIKKTGASLFSGKTVIDTTNPIEDAPPVNGVIKFFTDLNESLLEKLQKAYPEIRFVKAFNSIGNSFMVNPAFPGGKPSMFYCGNDEKAKAEVRVILEQFGFEPEDMGKAEAARAIEPLCMLWCIPGMLRNEWTHGFKLLKL